ncbi:hypothetical protein JT213_03565, partial [Helicobacter pylori]|nr:hypothetical protein [Helicobacter pylori]
ILRYNVSATSNFLFLVFHGKLLFRIYPHNHVYGGYFATIFLKTNTPLKTLSQKPLKSKITLQDELFCDFR